MTTDRTALEAARDALPPLPDFDKRMARPDELLPCPHCGCAAANVSAGHAGPTNRWHAGDEIFAVNCKTCGASVPNRYRNSLVVEAWNARAAQPQGDARPDARALPLDRAVDCLAAAMREANLMGGDRADVLSAFKRHAAALTQGDARALPAEPVATYIGHRLTPEGTKEFWGYADKPLPVGTKLYAAPQEAAPALDDARALTDEQIIAAMESAGVKFQAFPHPHRDEMVHSTAGSQSLAKIIAGVRALMQQETAHDPLRLRSSRSQAPSSW